MGKERVEKDRTAPAKIGNDFTEGKISSLLISFMAPFLLANLLTDLYNMVDMVIIGQFVGSAGIVAVTLGGKLLSMCTNVSIGLSAGGQIFISQQIGAKKPKEELNETIGTLFSFIFVLSVMLGIICLLLSEKILHLLGVPQESYASAVSYFKITSIGMPLVFGYNAVSSVLRGLGDSRRPLLFIGIAASANLVLDLVFVLVFHLGAMGTALATVIGQGIAFVFAVQHLYRKREQFDFDFKKESFQICPDKLRTMLEIGVPTAFQSILIQGTQLIIIRSVNGLGIATAAAYGIVEKIITLTSLVTQSIKNAGGTIVGQNVGAGKYDRAKETLFVSLRITLTVALMLSVTSNLIPKAIFGLFTNDPDVMVYAPGVMQVASVGYFLSAIVGSFDEITTGTGNAKLSFLAGFLDGVVFRLILAYLFGVYFDMGVIGFFMGNSFARIGPIMVHTAYYFSGAWKRVRRLVD